MFWALEVYSYCHGVREPGINQLTRGLIDKSPETQESGLGKRMGGGGKFPVCQLWLSKG